MLNIIWVVVYMNIPGTLQLVNEREEVFIGDGWGRALVVGQRRSLFFNPRSLTLHQRLEERIIRQLLAAARSCSDRWQLLQNLRLLVVHQPWQERNVGSWFGVAAGVGVMMGTYHVQEVTDVFRFWSEIFYRSDYRIMEKATVSQTFNN